MAFSFNFLVTAAGTFGSDGFNSTFQHTESGVTFTFSGTGTTAGFDGWNWNSQPAPDHQMDIQVTSGAAQFTMNFADTAGNSSLTGNINLGMQTPVGAVNAFWLTAGGTGGGVVAVSAGGNFAATGGVSVTGIRFTASGLSRFEIDSLTSVDGNLVCYLEGTEVSTTRGAVAVEDLKAGDEVLTADGRAVNVEWVGIQEIAAQYLHPAKVNPICISAGAIADNVPSRDLYVSPDHAIEIDGLLENASTLVNGRSIYQMAKMPTEGFRYYHIETAAHEVLLAEGCPAESYLDMPDRSMFINGHERVDGPSIQEMDLPRISSARLLPEELRAKLAQRADLARSAA